MQQDVCHLVLLPVQLRQHLDQIPSLSILLHVVAVLPPKVAAASATLRCCHRCSTLYPPCSQRGQKLWWERFERRAVVEGCTQFREHAALQPEQLECFWPLSHAGDRHVKHLRTVHRPTPIRTTSSRDMIF